MSLWSGLCVSAYACFCGTSLRHNTWYLVPCNELSLSTKNVTFFSARSLYSCTCTGGRCSCPLSPLGRDSITAELIMGQRRHCTKFRSGSNLAGISCCCHQSQPWAIVHLLYRLFRLRLALCYMSRWRIVLHNFTAARYPTNALLQGKGYTPSSLAAHLIYKADLVSLRSCPFFLAGV
jgi:hypothetical protein